MQSVPAASKASFSRDSAPRNVVFQSLSNCWRAGPSHAVPLSAAVTVLTTPSMLVIWFFIARPSAASCSGLAPYMLISRAPSGRARMARPSPALTTTNRPRRQSGEVEQRQEQGDAVGHERRGGNQLGQRGGVDPADLDHLAVVEAERAVVDDPVA